MAFNFRQEFSSFESKTHQAKLGCYQVNTFLKVQTQKIVLHVHQGRKNVLEWKDIEMFTVFTNLSNV